MFVLDELDRIIDLHQKSYALLKWVNKGLQRGVLRFNYIHGAMDAANAAKEWIGRHFENIPMDIRPPREYLDEFAHLFSSYLTTSFELVEKPGTSFASNCDCYCPMCCYLVSANHLKTKKISKKANKSATALKKIYLNSVASEVELALLDHEIMNLMKNPEMKEKISLATYANELIRRSQFASQGEGILVLWRDIAWQNGKLKKNYMLRADIILEAEKEIIQNMKNYEQA